MGIIKKLYHTTAVGDTDLSKQEVYPVTATGAVYSPTGASAFPNKRLDQILTSLIGGYQYVGKATTATTPGSYDHPVFYLASEAESTVYPNFGSGVTVSGLTVIKYNGSTWDTDVFDIAASGGGGGGGGTTDLYIGKTHTQNTSQAQALSGISNLFLETGGKIYFGLTDAAPYIEYDAINAAFHFSKATYSDEQVAAGGIGTSGGGGGGSSVAWNQIQQTGTKIATITINGVSTDVYAPTGGGGGTTYSAGTGLTLTGTQFSLNQATQSGLGGIKVGSTVSSATINSITSAAGRNYYIQCKSDGTAFVNVPWQEGTSGSGITGIQMNGQPVSIANNVANLGTVITDISGKQDKVSALGSLTEPVFISGSGTFSKCTKYAGGSKVSINDTPYGGLDATFYAPIGKPDDYASGNYYTKLNNVGAAVWQKADSTVTSGSTALITSGGVYSHVNSIVGNYVDLTNPQNVGGIKTFTSKIVANGNLQLPANGGSINSGANELLYASSSSSITRLNNGYSNKALEIYGAPITVYRGTSTQALNINSTTITVGGSTGFNLVPAAQSGQTYTLGSSSNIWDELYTKVWRPTSNTTTGPKITYTNSRWEITGDLVVTGYVTAGGTNSDNNTTLSGNLLPATSGLNIGASDNKINNIFATQLGNNTSGGKITNIYVNHSYVDDAHITVANISGTLSIPTITLTTAQSSTFEAELEHESGYTSSAINAYIGGTTLSDIIIGDVWVIKSTNYTLRVTGWRKNGTLYELYMGKFTFIQQSGGSNWKIYKTA